jgi:uncharacterized Zn-binding protein involved in type VI secretion
MPALARANGTDKVLSITGSGYKCKFPRNVTTGSATQTRVTAEGVPVVVQGDTVAPHPLPGCVAIDSSALNAYSGRVSIGGMKVARIGDTYGQGDALNTITSGSSRVFAG